MFVPIHIYRRTRNIRGTITEKLLRRFHEIFLPKKY